MALQDLIARIEADTREQVRAIAARADADVRDIGAAAAAKTARELADVRASRRAERRRGHARDEARARRQARGAELAARHARLDRVFARVRELLPGVESSSGYGPAVAAHAAEALSFLGDAPARLRCGAAAAPALASIAAARASTTLAVDPAAGSGVIAESIDGAVVVDNTLWARFERLRPELSIELASEIRP